MDVIKYLVQSLPVVVVLLIWAVRLEKKITRIETDISWIKKELPSCRRPSAVPTP